MRYWYQWVSICFYNEIRFSCIRRARAKRSKIDIFLSDDTSNFVTARLTLFHNTITFGFFFFMKQLISIGNTIARYFVSYQSTIFNMMRHNILGTTFISLFAFVNWKKKTNNCGIVFRFISQIYSGIIQFCKAPKVEVFTVFKF